MGPGVALAASQLTNEVLVDVLAVTVIVGSITAILVAFA